jgi:hypothetical protein
VILGGESVPVAINCSSVAQESDESASAPTTALARTGIDPFGASTPNRNMYAVRKP